MSKRRYFGSAFDQLLLQPTNRVPAYKVYCWNPNRTDIHDVVLGEPTSPRYDITDWVISVQYDENIVFENNDDAIAGHCVLTMLYDDTAQPIEITEKTMLDGTPIRIYQGDERIPEDQWVVIFTGVARGVPSLTEHSRHATQNRQMTVTAVDRAEKYLNKVVTARAYDQNLDVGKAAVETAIDWLDLDRREIKIGFQDYPIAHEQSQLVDIEVLKGIHQILFPVGKKPRFDAEGFLVAADTDLNRAPVRRYENRDFIVQIARQQILSSIYNSVRLLGLDDDLTEVVEKVKRLAHGSITAGYFEDEVEDTIYFSENDGKTKGGRRAKNTFLGKKKISTIGDYFAENIRWVPTIEDDGYTVFSGEIIFDTGYDPEIKMLLVAVWLAAKIVMEIALAEEEFEIAAWAEAVAMIAMLGIMLSMMELGRVYWEIHGQPFQNVYQQICATAQLNGILTEDVHEIELRNDWLYDLDYMEIRVKELLRRELIKGWSYQITMVDDPLVEVDDILQIEDEKYYITSMRKILARPGTGLMTLQAWRLA